jgi:hypothetical protein
MFRCVELVGRASTFCLEESFTFIYVDDDRPGVYSVANRNEYQKHKNNVSGE